MNNIAFYFLNYNNEICDKWNQLIKDVTSFDNEVHIITNSTNIFKPSNDIKHHSLDLLRPPLFAYMTKRIINDIDSMNVNSSKIILRNSGHHNFYLNAYLHLIAQKWNYIIEKNNLDAVYLMEPLNVKYNPIVIILEALCSKKNINFNFIRHSFIHYNIEIHDCLRRVKTSRLRKCYDENYWNMIDSAELASKSSEFKNTCLEFMRSNEFIYSVSKGNKQVEKTFISNKKINFGFRYVLLLLTKTNNPREIYVSTNFMDKIKMIYELNDSLPAGYKLVVKDHPHNIEKKDKSINNLQKAIKGLENVIYFNSDFTTIDLVAESDLVISTSSHSAYQALFQDKKVALFGDNLFLFGKEIAPVFRLKSYDGLRQKLEEIIDKNVPSKEIDRLMYLLNKSVKKTGLYGADKFQKPSQRDINKRCSKIILDHCQIINRS